MKWKKKMFTLEDGWIKEATKVLSPNCNKRPPQTEIELVVIHSISLPPGIFDGKAIEAFFSNQLDFSQHTYYEEIADLKVSAHFLIKRDGGLVNFVSTEEQAWHAGVSTFLGKTQCNDFSIGIELEGTDTLPYTEEQYQQLLTLLVCLQDHYPLIRDPMRLVGHCDIAPGRKTDPGPAFDWHRLRHEFRTRIQCEGSST